MDGRTFAAPATDGLLRVEGDIVVLVWKVHCVLEGCDGCWPGHDDEGSGKRHSVFKEQRYVTDQLRTIEQGPTQKLDIARHTSLVQCRRTLKPFQNNTPGVNSPLTL